MIGRLSDKAQSVAIVGGGAAGLFAASVLSQHSHINITLYEDSSRLGGLLASTKTPYGLIEAAANSLVATHELRRFAARLGVTLQPLAKNAQTKFIQRDGRLRRYPLSVTESLGMMTRILLVGAEQEDPSCRDFALRHLGAAAADYLIEPMLTGIYGATAEDLVLQLTLPRLRPVIGQSLLARMLSSDKSEKREVVALKGGMQALIDAVSDDLQRRFNVKLHLNHRVNSLGELNVYDSVMICTPSTQAAEIFATEHPRLSSALQSINYSSLVSVAVFVASKDLKRIPRGLGVLIPPKESSPLLGILFSSSCFPDRAEPGFELLTIIMGGQRNPHILGWNDARIHAAIQTELQRLFGLSASITAAYIHRWPRAIPRYDRALQRFLNEAPTLLPQNTVLFGNYTGDVSLRAMLASAMKRLDHRDSLR